MLSKGPAMCTSSADITAIAVACSPDTCIGDPLLLVGQAFSSVLLHMHAAALTCIEILCPFAHAPAKLMWYVIQQLHDRGGFLFHDQSSKTERLFPARGSWFVPVIPELPSEGFSVVLQFSENLPLHYFLDEEDEDTLDLYVNSISVEAGGGRQR